MVKREAIYINGSGETSRDFCFIENVIQMNLLAAFTDNPDALNQVYNVGLGLRTSLNGLFDMLRVRLSKRFDYLSDYKPVYRDFREGDIMHSQADIGRAIRLLGYCPTHTLAEGLDRALDWYVKAYTVTTN